MATNTPKYGFKKPGQDEFYNIDDQNSNWDKAEQAIETIDNKISTISVPVRSVNTKTGDITLSATDIKTTDGKTIESQLAEKAPSNHNHNGTYANANHNHNGTYEPPLPSERKRKTVYSTADPSGTDWDVWIKYKP